MDKVVDDFVFHTVVKQKLVIHGPPYQGRVKMSIIGRCIAWNIIYIYICVCVCVCVTLYFNDQNIFDSSLSLVSILSVQEFSTKFPC